jgi:hypothetical protein
MEKLAAGKKPKVISVTQGEGASEAKAPASKAKPRIVAVGSTEQSDIEKEYEHDTLIAGVIAESKAGAVQSNEESIVDADEEVDAEEVKKMEASRFSEDGSSPLSFLTTIHAEWWVQLSPSQQQILGLLLAGTAGLTLAQIMAKTKLSQNTAFNALYQLRGDDKAEIARKPEVPFPLISVKKQVVGKKKRNIYFANEKIRNVFTMS